MIVKALDKTEIVFTLNPMLSKKGIIENTRPIKIKNGVPGGCGTCIKYDDAINSPQSQKETVGCTVEK